MTMKNNAKFEEELTCHFKTDMRNLTNFDSSTRKSKKLLFKACVSSFHQVFIFSPNDRPLSNFGK